jgi:hypothetical protein
MISPYADYEGKLLRCGLSNELLVRCTRWLVCGETLGQARLEAFNHPKHSTESMRERKEQVD